MVYTAEPVTHITLKLFVPSEKKFKVVYLWKSYVSALKSLLLGIFGGCLKELFLSVDESVIWYLKMGVVGLYFQIWF